jgi:hypothetical protein
MPSLAVLPIPNQISRLLGPSLWNRSQFLRMPRVAHGFLDIEVRIVVEKRWVCAEELAVRVNGSWEGVGEPVEGDGVEEFVWGGRGGGPGLEFFSDPAWWLVDGVRLVFLDLT